MHTRLSLSLALALSQSLQWTFVQRNKRWGKNTTILLQTDRIRRRQRRWRRQNAGQKFTIQIKWWWYAFHFWIMDFDESENGRKNWEFVYIVSVERVSALPSLTFSTFTVAVAHQAYTRYKIQVLQVLPVRSYVWLTDYEIGQARKREWVNHLLILILICISSHHQQQ